MTFSERARKLQFECILQKNERLFIAEYKGKTKEKETSQLNMREIECRICSELIYRRVVPPKPKKIDFVEMLNEFSFIPELVCVLPEDGDDEGEGVCRQVVVVSPPPPNQPVLAVPVG